MTGLDTNILVRYLTHDDDAQWPAVLRLLNRKNATFFVSDFVLIEVDWVLTSLYRWTRDGVAEALGRLLGVHNLVFESEARILGALRAVREGADLADALIATRARELNCRDLATFDRNFAKRYPQFAFVPK